MWHALERLGTRASQTTLAPAARRANVQGVFAASRAGIAHLPGSSVVLVDDVLTTGATAEQAAATLVGAGARRVVVATFARALPELRDAAAA